MEIPKIRHMFPGGNTACGFYSNFNYILPMEEAEKIYIFKGGPGTGKSTIMKKIGAELSGMNYDVEYFHCSSDPDSLDAIMIPKLKVALMDGTAPHVIDPKYPGAVDEIINLGSFWDTDKIKKKKKEIMFLSDEIGRHFKRAYRYLKAAACFKEDNHAIFCLAFNVEQMKKSAYKEVGSIFGKDPYKGGSKTRKLFASAITPSGLKNFLETIINTDKVIVLKGSFGTELFIDIIKEEATKRGYYTECFYCGLNPEKIEHIVIPEKGVSITTSNGYHNILNRDFISYDFDEYLNKKILKCYTDVIEYNKLEYEGLLNRAVNTLEKTKKLHDDIEGYYVPSMDFEKSDLLKDELIKKICHS